MPILKERSRVIRFRNGFTLIELMVVVVLIGIVTAMILPEMKGTFDDMVLRSTARNLVSAFALASSQAATVSRPHRVRLEAAEGHFTVEAIGRAQRQAVGLRPVEEMPGARGELDRRIRIEIRRPVGAESGMVEENALRPYAVKERSSADSITFYADGTADPAEILLRDPEGFGLSLQINGTTGRVRVREVPSP